MSNTGERPNSSAPGFVSQAANRRYALAAGFCRGNTVLDIGCGEGGLRTYIENQGAAYHGIDQNAPDGISFTCNDLFSRSFPTADTVVCLETIEHVDPARQVELIEKLWLATQKRLIISTPSPDALRWYPLTEHFFSVGNPYHTREIHEWTLRRYIAQVCPNRQSEFILRCQLETNDETVWGVDSGPPAYYMLIVDR